jgi:signal transduction histidine kinase/CheY-like chemotaxis protein
MTFTTAIAITSAALAIYVAVLNHRFARAPGWSDQRWFSWVAFAIAAYSILNVPITLLTSDALVLAASRAQLLAVPAHSAAWLMYSRGQAGTPVRRWEVVLAGVLLALGLVGLVPDVIYQLPLRRSAFEPLGITYVVPQTTLLGDLVLGLSVATLALVAGRFFVAWRRRSRYAFIQFVALVTFFALAANDTLIAMGVYAGPYLVDLGFVVPVGVVGYSLTSRFAEDARALAELRTGLQKLVDERTRQLTQAQDALHEAEKLAALGQFSTGVAHEVNNPAAVVSANLKYIEESLDQGGGLPQDARDCIRECITAVDRIAGIVRQLLDAGRLAANKIPLAPVSVAACAREAAAQARARAPDTVAVGLTVDENLFALGQERIVVQVLSNLVVNGAQAIPEGRRGRVSIRAERAAGGRVRVIVDDDGVGIADDVLRRIFEPFFSTKPFGVGTGLGLSVSRGLTLSMGGSLKIESAVGKGTRAILELDEATRPAAGALAGPQAPAGERRKLLLLDDDPAVLRALARVLEPHYEVFPAGSVEEALALADLRRPDLLLCDVMMPDGGGAALYHALQEHLPHLAGRVIFLTGGADKHAVQEFFAHQPQPVLEKPLDLASLARAAERLLPSQAKAACDTRDV